MVSSRPCFTAQIESNFANVDPANPWVAFDLDRAKPHQAMNRHVSPDSVVMTIARGH
jgi:hypothetical protein